MLLTIDVGNTNTVLGLFDENDELVDHWRASTDVQRTSDEWLLLIGQMLEWRGASFDNVTGPIVASVVPTVTQALRRMCDRIDKSPTVLTWETPAGMPIAIDNPREVGADRIANAVAAYEAHGGPAIVVDLGTATTLDVVSSKGEYIGGVILPGIDISLDALFLRAAALKRIEFTPPDNVIGRNTVDALRSGATYGYAAQVDGLCALVEKELGPCAIIATGGLSGTIAKLSERIALHDPWLTLRGLNLIYKRVTS